MIFLSGVSLPVLTLSDGWQILHISNLTGRRKLNNNSIMDNNAKIVELGCE
jgi:hypothetical protein